jgi:hypothetical protein
MALCINIGQNTKASGMCCVAIGDDLDVRGAFQVKLGTQITLPGVGSIKPEYMRETVAIFQKSSNDLRELLLTYKAMEEQKYAPANFVIEAEKAIYVVLDILANRMAEMVKNFPEEKEVKNFPEEKEVKNFPEEKEVKNLPEKKEVANS